MTAKTSDTAAGPALTAPARPGYGHLRRFLADWLPASPLLAVIAVCLVAPLLVLVVQTFFVNGSFTLDLWTSVLGRPSNQEAIVTSLALAATAAVLTFLIGSPVAWLISRMLPRGRAFWLGLLNVGANFGGIGIAFAYLATLGAVGMVTLFLQGLGLPFEPPRSSSFAALLLAFLYTNVPLFVLLTIPAMGILSDDWWEAAQTASATRFQFWRMVGVPVLLPFLAAGLLLIFTWSIGIYGIAYGLAGQSGGTAVRLITLQIGSVLSSDVLTGTNQAAVLSVVLLAIAGVSLFAYRRLMKRGLKWL